MAELSFHLDNFEGPLDLLLTLVSKHKMDLHDIPILELIEQYTTVVAQAQRNDPAVASSFIEMAAHLVEMKSFLLLPRSTEGERMKQELTGQLIEYDLCRRMAAELRTRAERVEVNVRAPAPVARDAEYRLRHDPALLVQAWNALAGRSLRSMPPKQETFDPLVTAPFVSVTSRVVYVLRSLVSGRVQNLRQLFPRGSSRSTTVATFLAVLELVRGGRMEIGPKLELTLLRGRRDAKKEEA